MDVRRRERAGEFRALHQPGRPLLLANVWDAGSARCVESCGAAAIATTSAGLAWARGYPDGDALPPRVLVAVVTEIARAISVPLSVDVEGGYSADPRAVGDTVAAVIDAGAIGVNLEDGGGAPDVLCAKIAAAKEAAARSGADLFVNARTDVVLRALVPPERALGETIERGRRYRAAGADGIFVPGLADVSAMRAIASELALPLNVMLLPGLAGVAELASAGVARLSAGSAMAQSVYGAVRRMARGLFTEGRFDAMFEAAIPYAELNASMSPARRARST